MRAPPHPLFYHGGALQDGGGWVLDRRQLAHGVVSALGLSRLAGAVVVLDLADGVAAALLDGADRAAAADVADRHAVADARPPGRAGVRRGARLGLGPDRDAGRLFDRHEVGGGVRLGRSRRAGVRAGVVLDLAL